MLFIDPATIASQFPSEVSEVNGNDLNIVCVATGKPPPSVQWYFNDSLISSTCDDCQITITSTINDSTVSSSLGIVSVNESAEGVYTCSAANTIISGDAMDSITFRLNIVPGI